MRWPWFRRNRLASVQTADEVLRRGRRMAANAPYMFPIDVEENSRLDLQHYLLRYVLRGNFVAPIRHPTSILDIGCGTGRWAAEMARQFPRAAVTGVDIVPPTITSASVVQGGISPPNCRFLEGDVTKGLPFATGSFDFVHMRLVVLA
ncbi:MAG TPA: class I SAM-dependent methyltransferase, partial [Ktedonobacterales bacterium]|nr:class I SAM-dependent methyltransferase [Ktedonobacterales bacterium]